MISQADLKPEILYGHQHRKSHEKNYTPSNVLCKHCKKTNVLCKNDYLKHKEGVLAKDNFQIMGTCHKAEARDERIQPQK